MLEQLRYTNHVNETIDFGKNGIYVDTNDLHDYEWQVSTKNAKITNLTYAVRKKKLPVTIICDSEEQGIATINRLMEITEKDCLSMQHGKIIIGNYYFRCFVTKSEKGSYLYTKRYLKVTLTLQSDFPFWVKETTNAFRNGSASGSFLDYPYDFPYDYAEGAKRTELSNSNFIPSNFRMIIYGSVVNPAITVAGHTYRVNATVQSGEYLVIDSTAKTIELIANNGAVTNCFNQRDRDSYIFEKIPVGTSDVSWSGDFIFDVILMEERSEPKWT